MHEIPLDSLQCIEADRQIAVSSSWEVSEYVWHHTTGHGCEDGQSSARTDFPCHLAGTKDKTCSKRKIQENMAQTTDLYGSLVLKLLSLKINIRESRVGPERGYNTEL